MNISTTNNRLFITELTEPYERLEIQFYPETVQETRNINLVDAGVLGYNNSGSQYTGGDDNVSFKLEFYATNDLRDSALKAARWLKSLGQANGTLGGQPKVALVFGKLWRGQKFLLKSYSVNYSLFDAENSQVPLLAEVQLSFKRVVESKTTLKNTRTI